jgi:hypothetical protein
VIRRALHAVSDSVRLVHLSARLLAGRFCYLIPLVVLVWPGIQMLRLVTGGRERAFAAADAQYVLLGMPLAMLATGLGVRIVAGEIDRRMLEVAYTVPGTSARVFVHKLLAAVLLLLEAELLLAVTSFLFFTAFPAGVLYGALQSSLFFLTLAMTLAAVFRSEVTGALATVPVLLIGLLFGAADEQVRISPFFDPLQLARYDPADVLAWTLQNRLLYAMLIGALIAVALARAERREKMLSG